MPINVRLFPSGHRFPPSEPNRFVGAVIATILNTASAARPILERLDNRNRLIRRKPEMSLSALLDRHEWVVELGQQPADGDEHHGQIRDEEPDDVAWVVAHGVEGWVREAEDDGEDGNGDVAEEGAPDDGDGPVFAGGDDQVEVAGELAALGRRVSRRS